MYVEVPWLMAGAMIFGAAIGIALVALLSRDAGCRPFDTRARARTQDRRNRAAGAEGGEDLPRTENRPHHAPADYDEYEIEEPTAEIARAEMEERMERAEAGLLKYVGR
jgi:DNA-binding response OmpR family regulator